MTGEYTHEKLREDCFDCGQPNPDYTDVIGIRWHWECFIRFDDIPPPQREAEEL